ncbi:kinase-like protein [Schizopora paradoxa]|uniref:Kinase-like protein n=1 Tax=Schizopora paradoxa TaxID=27342 RepID=A0A0H2RHE7_9AGAM|nr:kinase-like protein [Schizopora paradoxa]
MEGVGRLGWEPGLIKSSMDVLIKFLLRIQEKFKAFFLSDTFASQKMFEKDILPVISWFKTSLDYMTEEFQVRALRHLLAVSKRSDATQHRDLEKAAYEFVRYKYSFGSDSLQVSELGPGSNGQRGIEGDKLSYNVPAVDLGLISRRREEIREKIFIDELAINGLPAGILLQHDLLRFGTMEPEPVTDSTFYDIYRGTYLAQTVAIKKTKAYTGFDGSESVKHFVKEAKIWRSACEVDPTEEFILKLIGVSFLDVSFIMVSRWMRNRDLLTYIRKHGERVDRGRMVQRIAKALGILHDRTAPIAHGHLKAENGDPLLGDFGLSTSLEDVDKQSVVDLEGRGARSFRWFAPEILVGDAQISTRSDIYAFAMTVLEIMTGEAPFNHIKMDTEVPLAISKGGRPNRPENDLARGLDDHLWELVERCWAQNPDDRPNIFDVNNELDQWGRAKRNSDDLGKGISANSPLIDALKSSSSSSRRVSLGLLQTEELPVCGETSHIFDIYRGYYLSQLVAIKSTKPLVCSEWNEKDEERIHEAARHWIVSCEEDPQEEYFLPFLGVALSRETMSIKILSRWMKNRDLLTYISEQECLGLDAKRITRRIAKCLEILHKRNPPTIHGRLRASNIIVNDNGDPLLGGFELSEVINSVIVPNKVEAQEIDSLRWLAPEFHDLEDDDEPTLTTQSDIYALAMSIFEIMAGKQPFQDVRKSRKISNLVMNGGRPQRPKEQAAIDRGLDDDLWDLLSRCWAQEPSDRPDIFEVNKELDEMWPDIKISEEAPQSIDETPVETSLEVSAEATVEPAANVPVEAPAEAPVEASVEVSTETAEPST